jgi:hypothetical protein
VRLHRQRLEDHRRRHERRRQQQQQQQQPKTHRERGKFVGGQIGLVVGGTAGEIVVGTTGELIGEAIDQGKALADDSKLIASHAGAMVGRSANIAAGLATSRRAL